jgi:hypothetical protein
MPHPRMALALLLAGAACGGGGGGSQPSNVGHGYALGGAGGVYADGSGRLGVAILATVRDAAGDGPAAPWSGTATGPAGVFGDALVYDAPGAGSYSTFLFPAEAASAGEYRIALGPDGSSPLEAPFAVGTRLGLPLADVSLAPDASAFSWPAVSGGASYACQVSSGGALQLATLSTATGCDLSALLPGSYSASVLAFSTDLTAIGAGQQPPLPAVFDVSEARMAFVKPVPGSDPPLRVLAAGGAYDEGTTQRTLAIWLSFATPDGTPTGVPWDVTVIGPGLPPSAPLAFTYHASFPRQMVWSYDVPAAAGTYSLTATSTAGAISGLFTVGDPAVLDLPVGVSANDGAQGSATVMFTPVTGARSYLVSAYDAVTGALAASAWFAETTASFPQGSFTAGATYDVYVAATDADMVGGAAPTQVSVAENLFDFASFVAR